MEAQHSKNVFYINKKFFYLIVLFFIAAIIAGSSYFYIKYQNSKKLLNQPTAVSQDEEKNILASVGLLMELPKNENPTIATISNLEKLKSQPFFNNAKNGDKVLIYTKAKKAILYRPSVNKIIEVSSLNLGDSSAQTASPASATDATLTPSGVLEPSSVSPTPKDSVN